MRALKRTMTLTAAALVAGAGMVTMASTSSAIDYNPGACLDRSQNVWVDAEGYRHGYYRIAVPGEGFCNDIYIPYKRAW